MVQLMTAVELSRWSSVEAPLMANRRRVRDTDAHGADTRPSQDIVSETRFGTQAATCGGHQTH